MALGHTARIELLVDAFFGLGQGEGACVSWASAGSAAACSSSALPAQSSWLCFRPPAGDRPRPCVHPQNAARVPWRPEAGSAAGCVWRGPAAPGGFFELAGDEGGIRVCVHGASKSTVSWHFSVLTGADDADWQCAHCGSVPVLQIGHSFQPNSSAMKAEHWPQVFGAARTVTL
jgi:hypothetical protein